MSVYHILIINRAGSLIFDWENKQDETTRVEKTYSYPLNVILEVVDQKPTVVFGENDGIRIKYVVVAVNGRRLRGRLVGYFRYYLLDVNGCIKKPEFGRVFRFLTQN
jgi:hypothetical protein